MNTGNIDISKLEQVAPVIQIKRSNVPGVVPSGLAEGEIAVNLADETIYIGKKGDEGNVCFNVRDVDMSTFFFWKLLVPAMDVAESYLLLAKDILFFFRKILNPKLSQTK